MEILIKIFEVFHFLGFATLFAGLISQIGASKKYINKLIQYGAEIQLGTGLVLTGLREANKEEEPLNHTKIAIKLIILLIITILAVKNRKLELSKLNFLLLITLVIVEVAIAVLW